MATSVSRLHAQIAKLQQKADSLKKAAVLRVQKEIQLHGLTSEDLFGGGFIVGNRAKAQRRTDAKPASKAPKYGDSAGNTWGGMGKRPSWLKDALEAGASLADFLLAGPQADKPVAKLRKAAPAPVVKKARKAVPAKNVVPTKRTAKKQPKANAGSAPRKRTAPAATPAEAS
ncbi:H-NS family nucleoid-associated regulatory protein [Roseateles sp.]|uniref:H-NS histone family protein n=1 Tax=Roseateles sp. TaxID=1971397 RepID=UPI0039ED24FE